LAQSLQNLSTHLGDLGRREAALAAAEEAARRYRELAVARPDAYLSYLAVALINLASRFSHLGQRQAAPDAGLTCSGAISRVGSRMESEIRVVVETAVEIYALEASRLYLVD
jgi:hypothetical protein